MGQDIRGLCECIQSNNCCCREQLSYSKHLRRHDMHAYQELKKKQQVIVMYVLQMLAKNCCG